VRGVQDQQASLGSLKRTIPVPTFEGRGSLSANHGPYGTNVMSRGPERAPRLSFFRPLNDSDQSLIGVAFSAAFPFFSYTVNRTRFAPWRLTI